MALTVSLATTSVAAVAVAVAGVDSTVVNEFVYFGFTTVEV